MKGKSVSGGWTLVIAGLIWFIANAANNILDAERPIQRTEFRQAIGATRPTPVLVTDRRRLAQADTARADSVAEKGWEEGSRD